MNDTDSPPIPTTSRRLNHGALTTKRSTDNAVAPTAHNQHPSKGVEPSPELLQLRNHQPPKGVEPSPELLSLRNHQPPKGVEPSPELLNLRNHQPPKGLKPAPLLPKPIPY
jgi:hypothetical protein